MTTIDPAARKAAEAAVKAAEKKHAAAEKKSSAMRDKYLELQAATNRAARELVAARVNPDLFDDDPTTVIEPVAIQKFELPPEIKPGDVIVNEAAATVRTPAPKPLTDPPGLPEDLTAEPEGRLSEPPVTEAEVADEEIVDAEVVDGDAESADDPWNVPPPAAPAAEEKPKPKRRSSARQKAAEAAAVAEPAVEAEPEVEPDDLAPPSINSTPTMAPAF